MQTLSFLHSSKLGDAVYSLPSIREVCRKYKTKARFYQRINNKVINLNTRQYENMMTAESFELLKPLLLAQEFIESAEIYEGQPIDINFDFLNQQKIGMPYGSLMRYYFYAYPDMNCDLSEMWLDFVPVDKTVDIVQDSIIINRTDRYQNSWINYNFLNLNYTNFPIYFVGTKDEAASFHELVPRAMYLNVDDFNDLACAIANCKLFIGNQSLGFAIAEGLKTPRILEVCSYAPNIIPQGKNGYDFYTQKGFEYYCDLLLK